MVVKAQPDTPARKDVLLGRDGSSFHQDPLEDRSAQDFVGVSRPARQEHHTDDHNNCSSGGVSPTQYSNEESLGVGQSSPRQDEPLAIERLEQGPVDMSASTSSSFGYGDNPLKLHSTYCEEHEKATTTKRSEFCAEDAFFENQQKELTPQKAPDAFTTFTPEMLQSNSDLEEEGRPAEQRDDRVYYTAKTIELAPQHRNESFTNELPTSTSRGLECNRDLVETTRKEKHPCGDSDETRSSDLAAVSSCNPLPDELTASTYCALDHDGDLLGVGTLIDCKDERQQQNLEKGADGTLPTESTKGPTLVLDYTSHRSRNECGVPDDAVVDITISGRCLNDRVSQPVFRSALHLAESSRDRVVTWDSTRMNSASVGVENDISTKGSWTAPMTSFVSERRLIGEHNCDTVQEVAQPPLAIDRCADSNPSNVVGNGQPGKVQPKKLLVGHGEIRKPPSPHHRTDRRVVGPATSEYAPVDNSKAVSAATAAGPITLLPGEPPLPTDRPFFPPVEGLDQSLSWREADRISGTVPIGSQDVEERRRNSRAKSGDYDSRLVVLPPREPSCDPTAQSQGDTFTGGGEKRLDMTLLDDDDRVKKERSRPSKRVGMVPPMEAVALAADQAASAPLVGGKRLDMTLLNDDDRVKKERSRPPKRVVMVPPKEPVAMAADQAASAPLADPDDDADKDKKSAGEDLAREDSDVGTAAVPGAVAVPGFMFDERESYTNGDLGGAVSAAAAADAEMSMTVEPIMAMPVVDDDPVVLVHATPMMEGEGTMKHNRTHTCRSAVRDRRVQLVALVAIAAAVVAVTAAIMGNRAEDLPPETPPPSSFPSFAPTFETTESPRFVQLREVVIPAASGGVQTPLDDRGSPQYRALDWLSNEDAVSINDTQSVFQRYVLAVLYFGTGGGGWTKRDEFLSGGHECTWNSREYDDEVHGVEHCDALNRVTSIKLNKNNLVGQIPSEMEQLTELKELSMWSNKLSGTISPSIGTSLSNLFRLELDDNELTGTLPDLGGLTSLQRLLLFSNALSGTIPRHYGNLTSLTYLNLRDNKLNGTLCTEMGRLVKMSILLLEGNLLSGSIPSQLGLLTELTRLQLGSNKLTGTVGTELGELDKLTRLELFKNELSGVLPRQLGALTDLTTLNLRGNNLTGPIITELGRLVRLEILYLYTNNFSGGLPTELGDLANIQDISLRENNLTGPIITEFGRLETLESLYLWGNRLTGTVMDNWGRLGALTKLQLQGNLFTGRIPASIAWLTKLTHLDLSSNRVVGRIPVEIGVNVTGLTYLNLSRNELTSTVPQSFVNLASLTTLDLLNTSITGDLDFLCRDITTLQTVSADPGELKCECCTS